MSLNSINNEEENGLVKVEERQLSRDYHDHFTHFNKFYILYTLLFHAMLGTHFLRPRMMGKSFSAAFMFLFHDDS